MLHSSLLKAIRPNRLQAYRNFLFSDVCACEVCDRSRLPCFWLCCHDDYFTTAPAAPFLRLFLSSGSLLRCEPVQVHQHLPQSRDPPDPVHLIIVRDLPWGLEIWLFPLRAGWAIEPHFFSLILARAVRQSVVTCLYQVTGQLQVFAGIIVDVVYIVR
jgi:hypothetical protein